MSERLRGWARRLQREALTVYYVARHPGTPWHARALALVVAAYALSPIDLIPDFIPVLGLLDDLLLVPLGVWMVLRLVSPAVITRARAQAAETAARPRSHAAVAVIVAAWTLALAWLGWWATGWWRARA